MPKANRHHQYGASNVNWPAVTFLSFIGALVAVETFYKHPTYGNGISALLAAIQAGEAL